MKISIDNKKCMPERAHFDDAGLDLKSNIDDIEIYMGEQVLIDTGVRMEIPSGFAGIVIPRSGLGRKYRMNMANTIGVIDAQYRGNIFVPIVNNGDRPMIIKRFDRFCQIVITQVWLGNIEVVDSLDNTERGEGGFGHTGNK